MKLLFWFTVLSGLTGCACSSTKQSVATPEKATYFAVEPGQKTKVITYHIQVEKFSPSQQIAFNEALAGFDGKCWIWTTPTDKESLISNEPETCLKFVNFTNISSLKPYKRDPTDKKMLLTALEDENHFQIQNFVWDGKKLRRVRNSNSHLGEESLQDFIILWALK